MIDTPVARPAVRSVSADARHHLSVAFHAVRVYDFFRVVRGPYVVGVDASVEVDHILHPVYPLPDEVVHDIVVREVTVNAFYILMGG